MCIGPAGRGRPGGEAETVPDLGAGGIRGVPGGGGDGVRATYERAAAPGDAMRRAEELAARTVIVDVEPFVAHWDSGAAALDQGITRVLGQVSAVPGVQVLCFATNSPRRPTALPGGTGIRVVYLASAHKPLRTGPYRSFPRPGVVIGDQVATDGVLAWRLGFTFVQYQPLLAGVPAGPRLMDACGRLIQPLFFTRAG